MYLTFFFQNMSKAYKPGDLGLLTDDKIALHAFFNGQAVRVGFKSKQEYEDFRKRIKKGATVVLKDLRDEFKTDEAVVDFLKAQMNEWGKTIAQGYLPIVNQKCWALNVQCLLKLKAITNDDQNGWQLIQNRKGVTIIS